MPAASPTSGPDGSFTDIPTFDLSVWTTSATDEASAARRAAFPAELCRACHEVGFFLLTNHGIDETFLDEVFETMERLFALPVETKQLIDKRRSPQFRGWEAVGTEFTNNRPDIREQVDLWSEHPVVDRPVDPPYRHLLGPNQWFPEAVLPGYRALLNEWFARMGQLADHLLAILGVGLGLGSSGITANFGASTMSLTKLIHYPPTPPGQAGVNPHHDAGFLTLLAPGATPGLEVQNHAGEWIAVPNTPGSLVVNLGEMLQGITGNYFVATPHRVITGEERYSAAYFHGPSLDTPLASLSLPPDLLAAVDASPHHASAGFMTQADETAAGVAAMSSPHRPDVYGEQLWNYFRRSYPDMVSEHYPDLT